MAQDLLGNAIHVADAGSLAAVDDFVGGFIACEARVTNILVVAEHDHSLTVQVCAPALRRFAESPAGGASATLSRPRLGQPGAGQQT